MKMKCMVYGAWCMVLGASCLVIGASTAWAKPAILDGSRIGWWQFDNSSNYKLDSSGYGSSINGDISNGTTANSGGYSGGKITLGSGKSFTATLADSTPDIPGTKMPYYTVSARFKSGGSIISGLAGLIAPADLKSVMNDTSNWHFGAMRYQNVSGSSDPNTGGSKKYAVFLDPQYNVFGSYVRASSGDLELASDSPDFLMSYSGKTITVGGKISSYSWYGDLDEVMVFVRILTKGELTRLRQTGESYVFSNDSSPSFGTYSNWSCNESTVHLKPGDAFGAPYIVENGQTMTQEGTATFGGDVDKHVSLTLGRKSAVTYYEGNDLVTKSELGNFNHSSAGTLTFYDLRFVNGTYTAAGTGLTTTLLDVDTPAGSVFNINVTSSDYALNVSNDTTGDGVLAKQGTGKLTVAKWSGAAKLRMTAGTIKTPRLDGYTGGTVLVNPTTPVVFTGTDTFTGPMKIQVENAPTAAGTYTLMTVPSGSSASNFSDQTTYGDLEKSLSVEGTSLKLTLVEATVDPVITWNAAGGTDVGADIDKMEGVISLKYTGGAAPAAGTYPVQTIGGTKTYTSENFAIDWNGVSLPNYMSAAVTVNGKVVSVVVTDNRAKLPDADKGEVPVLIGR